MWKRSGLHFTLYMHHTIIGMGKDKAIVDRISLECGEKRFVQSENMLVAKVESLAGTLQFFKS